MHLSNEFNSRVMYVCLFDKGFDIWFTYVPRAKLSSMWRLQIIGLKTVLLRIAVSICAFKKVAMETAVHVPMAVPWVCAFH